MKSVNINITLPEGFLTRFLSAHERLATAIERLAGPVIDPSEPKPFGPELWGTATNANSREVELEEAQEATGYGPSYQRDLEARAARSQRPPNGSDDSAG